ncbi:hypothetical protein GGF43_003445 [Coemansia sp. RSA 2618]|nr:hypothetical protein GGF43_003445 [Coemansia sp. RSA 2618]
MPSARDDESSSRRRSRHADKSRDKRGGDREHRKSRRDSRRGKEARPQKSRESSPEKPLDKPLAETLDKPSAETPDIPPIETPMTAQDKSLETPTTALDKSLIETQTTAKDKTHAKAQNTTPARPKTARGSEAEDGAPTPDFRLSGKLAAEANTVNGVELKYSEPAEARRPTDARWRLYVFKDGKDIDMHHVADIPTDHPSCSSQHAVLQYRRTAESVKPYLIDLASTNGTFLNGERIPAQRFVELRSEDVIKLGFSSREFVLLQE